MAALAAAIIPALISGAAGFFGGKKQQEQKGTQDTNSTGQSINHAVQTGGGSGQTATRNYGSGAAAQAGTTTHNLSPFQQSLAQQFTTGAQGLANSAADMSGYTNRGLQDINDASSAQHTALQNVLASRGLSYSPAAGNAEVMGQQNRLNQQSSFLQGIPLLQRELQSKAQAGLVSAFNALPTDTATTQEGTYQNESQGAGSYDNSNYSNTDSETDTKQTGHTDQTGTVSGNPLAGALGGVGAGLMGPNSSSSTGNNMGGIIDFFSRIFGGGATGGSTGGRG